MENQDVLKAIHSIGCDSCALDAIAPETLKRLDALGLIAGDGREWRLTPKGMELFRSLNNEDKTPEVF